MSKLITRQRLLRLAAVASTQALVQAIGFVAGIVLVRHMAQVQYGYYTLAVSLLGMAVTLCDMGLATAVMSRGGRLLGDRAALGRVVGDAWRLQARMLSALLPLVMLAAAALLWRQQAAAWQAALLAATVAATALLTVRSGVALSVARLLGHIGLQQRLDLLSNIAKLAVLAAMAAWFLDATLASLVNLAVAAVSWWVLSRHLREQAPMPAASGGEHAAALREHLWKQAPNTVYFVCSSQLGMWLIGLFGSAERVAEVGALGRLAALFTLIGTVSAALVLPYFARQQQARALVSGFAGVNAFYVALLAVLLTAAWAAPGPILWILGERYAGLQTELAWMVAAATLSAWGGALYGAGCARGWVMPVGVSIATGMLATAGAALAVDVASVRGVFMINTATGLASTVAGVGYLAWKLRQHAQLPAQLELELTR